MLSEDRTRYVAVIGGTFICYRGSEVGGEWVGTPVGTAESEEDARRYVAGEPVNLAH